MANIVTLPAPGYVKVLLEENESLREDYAALFKKYTQLEVETEGQCVHGIALRKWCGTCEHETGRKDERLLPYPGLRDKNESLKGALQAALLSLGTALDLLAPPANPDKAWGLIEDAMTVITEELEE